MCGIAGFLGRFDPELLDAMTRRIAHRGPDDHGKYLSADGSVGLGHRRLAIIDLAPTGHQPMVSASGRYVMVFNGEIYNYRELRLELEHRGRTFRGSSDSEVLLELFAEQGIEALPRLNGIFAFAVWDNEAKTLTVVRDGLGVKPLYYAELGAGFLFASELKSVLMYRDVPRDYDREALAHYLTYLWAPSPRTPLRAVRKLEPGQWLTVRDGRIDKRGTFYRLPGPAVRSESAEQTINDLDSTLRAAVERQLVSDVPVAAFLSGGVDSSAVVALAQRKAREPLECFTIRYDDDGSQQDGMVADLPYARSVAKHLGVKLHEVHVDSAQMPRDLEWMVEQLDEPQADPACLNAHYICRHARKLGYKVMLSGTGGDDVFSGYRRHAALQNERYWAWLPKPARRAATAGTALLSAHGSAGRRIAKAFRYADLNDCERLASYFFWTHPGVTHSLLPGLDADVAAPLKSALEDRPDIHLPLDRMLFLDMRFFLGDHNLPYTDKMSMANGVEVRVPLIDMEVVKFASTVPADLKQHGQSGKWVFKRAVAPYLPKEILSRPKTGFGVPLREWLRGPLRTWMRELLGDATRSIGLFEPDAVWELLEKTERKEVDGSYTLLALMCITLWHQRYVAAD